MTDDTRPCGHHAAMGFIYMVPGCPRCYPTLDAAQAEPLNVERLAEAWHVVVAGAWGKSGTHAHLWCVDSAELIAAEYARLAAEA